MSEAAIQTAALSEADAMADDVHVQDADMLYKVLEHMPVKAWFSNHRPIIRRSDGSRPDFVIGLPEDPYLIRWWMIPRNREGNHYRHCILKSDDDRALHDHPWDSVSVVLEGVLKEHLSDGSSRILEIGKPYFRKATDAHRLEVIEGPVWTDFFTGPKVREWGFHCPQGWVHWKEFTAENPGEIGRGCGED